MTRPGRFPLTYDECRERFRWTCHPRRVAVRRAPDRGEGSIRSGADDRRRLLRRIATPGCAARAGRCPRRRGVLVVHAHVRRTRPMGGGRQPIPASRTDAAVVMIHGVNPWGMDHWRRQNESNVDLNRNWGRDERTEVPANPGYDELHPYLVPGGSEPPTPESLLDRTRALIDEHGYQWVKSAVTDGQFDHPDGLYFGGDRTEESNLVVARVVARTPRRRRGGAGRRSPHRPWRPRDLHPALARPARPSRRRMAAAGVRRRSHRVHRCRRPMGRSTGRPARSTVRSRRASPRSFPGRRGER